MGCTKINGILTKKFPNPSKFFFTYYKLRFYINLFPWLSFYKIQPSDCQRNWELSSAPNSTLITRFLPQTKNKAKIKFYEFRSRTA